MKYDPRKAVQKEKNDKRNKSTLKLNNTNNTHNISVEKEKTKNPIIK